MAEQTPLVSIIIRCFNEEKYIGRLLQLITGQDQKSVEIILVDSGSTDRTLEIAATYPVRIIHIRPEDFTFGYSLNKGLEAAKGEFLIMASAHVEPVRTDWIDQMIKPFEDQTVAKVYGRQIGTSVSRYSEHQVFAQQFPEESNLKQTIPFCNNANSAIRKSLWLKHQYDETLTGLEDLAWGKWAIENGYLLAYNAEAAIIHIHHESPKKILNRYKREAIALKRIFPDSHMTFGEFFSLWFSNIFHDIMRAIKYGYIFSKYFEILMFRSMQYWGTYRGINDRSRMTHDMMMRFYYPRELDKMKKLKEKLKKNKTEN